MGKKQFKVVTLKPQPLQTQNFYVNEINLNDDFSTRGSVSGGGVAEMSGGKSSLIIAIEKGKYELVNTLLRNKFDVNYQDNQGNTALILAVMKNFVEIVRNLLQAGATIEIQDMNGLTAVHHACIYGHESALNMMLRKGPENVCLIRDSEGKTPLHVACINGFSKCVYLLLNIEDVEVLKSFLDARDEASRTALHLAAAGGHNECVDMLILHGSQTTVQDDFGNTPLHDAVRHGTTSQGLKTIELLVKATPDLLTIKNYSQLLPSECSADANVVNYLRRQPLLQQQQHNQITQQFQQLQLQKPKITPITITMPFLSSSTFSTSTFSTSTSTSTSTSSSNTTTTSTTTPIMTTPSSMGRERVSVNNSTSATSTPFLFSLADGKLLDPTHISVSIPAPLPLGFLEIVLIVQLFDSQYRKCTSNNINNSNNNSNNINGNRSGCGINGNNDIDIDDGIGPVGLRRFVKTSSSGSADFSDLEVVLPFKQPNNNNSNNNNNNNNNNNINTNNTNITNNTNNTNTIKSNSQIYFLQFQSIVDYNLPTQRVHGFSHFVPIRILSPQDATSTLCLQMTKMIWNGEFTGSAASPNATTTMDSVNSQNNVGSSVTRLPWLTLSQCIRNYFDECVPVDRKLSDSDLKLIKELCDPSHREYVEFEHFHNIVMRNFLFPLLDWLQSDKALQMLWNHYIILVGSRESFPRKDVTHLRFATTTSRRLSVGDNAQCGWYEATTVVQALKLVQSQRRPVLLAHGKTIDISHELLSPNGVF